MRQPWIYSAAVDTAFILAPALVITALLLMFHEQVAAATLEPWMWGVLIVGVDVAHVYSTLFRTYADADEWRTRRALYTLAPLAGWAVGALLYSVDAIWFWRAIAYLAVFHFMRQQYGFMMIYARYEREPGRIIDQAAIYFSTLYPLLYWHCHARSFEWFIEGDFIRLQSTMLADTGLIVYLLVLCAYAAREIKLSLQRKTFNLPKNLLLLGTASSWWVGIVAFNNDLAFTAANVLAHGIPYIALIWIYGRNQSKLEPQKRVFGISLARVFSVATLPLFIGLLVLLAYMEEDLWDGFVWTEHRGMFSPFQMLPAIADKATLAWLVPLLALPQITHYILDAFIWRMKTEGTMWRRILFLNAEKNA